MKNKFFSVIFPLDGYTEYQPENIRYFHSTLVNLETYLKYQGRDPKKLEISELDIKNITCKTIKHIKNNLKNQQKDKQRIREKELQIQKLERLTFINEQILQLNEEKMKLSNF